MSQTEPNTSRVRIGGKAASLARARRAGAATLGGVVITIEVSNAVDAGEPLAEMAALDDAFRRAGGHGRRLVARSSSVVEDQSASSAAGQFESVMGIDGGGELRDAVRVVLDSRERAGAADHPIAVLVQPMVDPSIAGVFFGVDPVTGRTVLTESSERQAAHTGLYSSASHRFAAPPGGVEQLHHQQLSEGQPIMQINIATRRPKFRGVLAAGIMVVAVAACGSDNDAVVDIGDGTVDVDVTAIEDAVDDVVDEVDSTSADLAQTLRDNGLDSAAGIIEQIDVSELLGDGEFTFFAPNDEAFTSLSADDMADLLTDPAQILETLRNHSLDGTQTAADLTTASSVDTRAGESLAVTVDGDTVMIGDVTVVTTDIEVGGGVIHVVDGFLLPS